MAIYAMNTVHNKISPLSQSFRPKIVGDRTSKIKGLCDDLQTNQPSRQSNCKQKPTKARAFHRHSALSRASTLSKQHWPSTCRSLLASEPDNDNAPSNKARFPNEIAFIPLPSRQPRSHQWQA
jgi:hypothetical protein